MLPLLHTHCCTTASFQSSPHHHHHRHEAFVVPPASFGRHDQPTKNDLSCVALPVLGATTRYDSLRLATTRYDSPQHPPSAQHTHNTHNTHNTHTARAWRSPRVIPTRRMKRAPLVMFIPRRLPWTTPSATPPRNPPWDASRSQGAPWKRRPPCHPSNAGACGDCLATGARTRNAWPARRNKSRPLP
jgi:hypothetical protein